MNVAQNWIDVFTGSWRYLPTATLRYFN